MKTYKQMLSEARAAQEDDAAETGIPHLVMQLRKSVSLRGQHPVKFQDGSTHKISARDANSFLIKHNKMNKPKDKEALVKSAHKNHGRFQDALKGIVHDDTPRMLPKLASEETGQLDELSPDMLHRYQNKAKQSVKDYEAKLDAVPKGKKHDAERNSIYKKYDKRWSGHAKSGSKLDTHLTKGNAQTANRKPGDEDDPKQHGGYKVRRNTVYGREHHSPVFKTKGEAEKHMAKMKKDAHPDNTDKMKIVKHTKGKRNVMARATDPRSTFVNRDGGSYLGDPTSRDSHEK